MPRQPRLDAPGLLQHVMARGIQRSRIFRDHDDYVNFVARLGTTLAAAQTQCFAWALLPDHFHLLLRIREVRLSSVMRSLMTGYAVTFNRRHRRNGHLFQNRYKSIICDDEPYLLELIRYIHLNPLRGGMVKSLVELDGYLWTGHSVLMGRQQNGWQETGEVLSRFSEKRSQARLHYRNFIAAGMDQKDAPDFEGGGRIRSLNAERGTALNGGGRLEVDHDERVLGKRGFVEKILKEMDLNRAVKKPQMPLPELVGKVSERFRVDVEDLLLGRRTREVSRARALVSYLAVYKMGYRFSEVGEALRVHPVSIARSLEKGKKVFIGHPGVLGSSDPTAD